jgi:hypothetical protein
MVDPYKTPHINSPKNFTFFTIGRLDHLEAQYMNINGHIQKIQ